MSIRSEKPWEPSTTWSFVVFLGAREARGPLGALDGGWLLEVLDGGW